MEVVLPGEEESVDSEDVLEIPEEMQPQVEDESADEAEEVTEEAVRDYYAEDGIPLESGASYIDVTVTEGTEYKETAELLHRYTFECKEEGEYRIDLIEGSSSVHPKSFEKQETSGDQERDFVDLKRRFWDPYYVELEANTKYRILFDSYDYGNPEVTCTWRIRKVSEKELVSGVSDTFSTEDAIRYKFSPTEDGLYQLTYNKDVESEVYAEKTGYDNYPIFGWGKKYNVYNLEAGETYRIYMSKPYGQEDEVEDCKIQWTKMSEKTIDTDQVYQKQENEPVYYRFKVKTAGRYLLDTNMNIYRNDQGRFYAFNDHERLTSIDLRQHHTETVYFASLEPGEEFVLIAAGECRSVCIGSVKNVDGFEYVLRMDGTVAILSYSGEEKKVVIPDEIDGKPVTTILPFVFEKSDIESVVLPSTLKEIGRRAFSGTNIESVELPSTLETIREFAFEGTKLKEIVIPDSVTYIEPAAFLCCTSLKKAVIGSGLEKIAVDLFQGCDSLEEVVIPGNGSVTRIEYQAFEGCKSLSKVTLPDGLEYIGYSAFACGNNMKSIVVPASVKWIEGGAFGYWYEFSQQDGRYKLSKLDDFVIYGQKGTAAEEYAIENGFEFLEKTPFARGDVDLSGKVDISDLRLMLRAVCGKVTLTADQIAAGDITGSSGPNDMDGKITIADLRRLLRFICGKIEAL